MPTCSATLADLFSKARLSLHVPSWQSDVRSVVYFDEVLNVEAVLTLPSDPLLPIATTSSQQAGISHTLPLPAQSSRTELGHHTIPPYLNALLACLHVNLFTDYVPHHPHSAAQYAKSTNPYEPLSTVQPQFEHLQLLPSHNPHSDPPQPQLAAVRAFSNSWAGNQPPKAHRTMKDAADAPFTSSHHAYLTHDTRHWSVHWHCRVPINFIATPFQPLLSITAALTLRLDPALLDQYIPASSSGDFVRSGFTHSLLAPLHEGPVYPDESPVQRQARATASAALGLDGPNGLGSYLAHLPKDVVGGKNVIVTPRSSVNALTAIQQSRVDASSANVSPNESLSTTDSNGDLATTSSTTASSTNLTPSASPSSQGVERETQERPAGLQIYKRSTREILPLKTGLNVRMRTLVTQHDPWAHRKPPSRQSSAQLESSRLVLSVELENPFESDSTFVVDDIQIKFDNTQNEQTEKQPLVVKALQPLSLTLPLQLTRGSQHNLLFYVSVESDQALHSDSNSTNESRLARTPRTRNVTITVSGRPETEREHLPGFDSQWNCALDLAPVLSDAIKKCFIANAGRAGKVNRAVRPVGPLAGNTQYSASSLRAAAQYSDPNSYTVKAEYDEDTRTPRPGHLGMGFPPPLRTSSAQHLSTVVHPTDLSRPTLAVKESDFLQKAKARAANRNLFGPWEETSAAAIVRPWMTSSASSLISATTAASTGGLVVLSTLRPKGAPSTGHDGAVIFAPSLGDDGVVRPSVSTGAKMLHPTSIAPSTDEKRVRVQTGDTVVVDLTLLHKPPTDAGATSAAIRIVNLSWSYHPAFNSVSDPAKSGASGDALAASKGKLIDADSARLKSNLSAEIAESINGLIPIQTHIQVQDLMHAGQSRKIALELRCLSPGYHMVPPLQLSFETDRGVEEKVVLENLGGVDVTPATVS